MTAKPRHGHAWAYVLLLVLLLQCVGGCKSHPKRDAAAPGPAPSYQQIADAHNNRLDLLKKTYARGVIELRWRDQNGKHFEQGNMELWVQSPSNTALRVDKLGEVLLWLGSNDERYWLFDMTQKEAMLRVGRHDAPIAADEQNALNIRPLALLDLLACTPLPVEGTLPPEVTYDAQRRAWTFNALGRGGPMRMYFDVQSLLPVRVETLSLEDKPAFCSALSKHQTASKKGLSPLGWPKIATQIDIDSNPNQPQEPIEGGVTGSVKIVLDEASADVDDAVLTRVFDLNRLMRAMNPVHVEGELPPQPAATASGR